MDRLKQFTHAFSKASISIDVHRIAATYTQRDIFYIQELSGDDLQTLISFVDECSCLTINVSKNKFISVTFDIETGLSVPVIYPPIEQQINLADIPDEDTGPGEIFTEFMNTIGAGRNVDMDFVRDYYQFWKSKQPPSFKSTEGVSLWRKFKSALGPFQVLSHTDDIIVTEYDEDFCGCAEFGYYDENTPARFRASDKAALSTLLKVSSLVSFEHNVANGALGITFYPEEESKESNISEL